MTQKDYINLSEIRNKDGIYLYRIKYKNEYFVIKYFLKDEYKREIRNYSILSELGIPTIKIFGSTDKSILLEDLDKSTNYRLGIASDLSHKEIAKALAKWYRQLHNKGSELSTNEKLNFYKEIDIITRENVDFVKYKSNTADNRVWDLLINNWDLLFEKVSGLNETLTYNDFYWTNLAVTYDKKEAIMVDYNLLGISYRYSDIRNVCSSLSEEARKAFIDEYGEFDMREKIIDAGISNLCSLINAYYRPVFPNWGQGVLKAVYNGNLENYIQKILELPS
jgi:aminoglycoside phosphotransferase